MEIFPFSQVYISAIRFASLSIFFFSIIFISRRFFGQTRDFSGEDIL